MNDANTQENETLQGQDKEEGQIMSTEHEQQFRQDHSGPAYQEQPYSQTVPPPGRPRKSTALATLLSMFPGLGQVYVGYYQTGFTFMLTVAFTIAMLSSSAGRGIEPFLGVFLSFFWIFNMIDANRRAQHYNQVMAGLQGEEVPDDFKIAGGKGSVPVGVILMVIGVLFILDLNFGISLEWLEDWWPLALVAFGGWLVFKGRQQN